MISIVVLAALTSSPSLPEYDAFGETASHPRLPLYSPAARARIEAGWTSNEEPRLGVPTFFWAPRDPTQANTLREMGLTAEQAARRWLFLYGELYRQDPASLAAQPVQEIHDLGDGVVIVRFRKVSNGVPVFRDTLNVVMSQGLQLVALSGYLSPHNHAREFKLAAPTALAIALQDASAGWLSATNIRGDQRIRGGWEGFTLDAAQSAGPARARKVLYPLADRLEAAWQLELSVKRDGNTDDAYSYVVSAEDGRLLMRHDLTSHAGYRVWADNTFPFTPWDGPQGTSPTPNPTGLLDGYQAPPVASQLITLTAIPPIADPWLAATATSLSGNNVDAYADLVAPDGFNADAGDLRIPASAPGVFDWAYDLDRNANASDTQRFASGTSAFYVANWAHDVLYARGFDEKAGNGQRSNFGRGGLEGDFVNVEVHDFSARNNSSMRTPADGAPGRLHAYLFDTGGPSLVGLSSDGGALDAGMIAAGPADFGPQVFDLTGNVVRGYDGFDAGHDGCDGPLLNAAEVTGNIVLFDTPRCLYATTAINAADAGAIGVLITHSNQGLTSLPGPAGLNVPPTLLIQRDAGFQLANRLDAGEATMARMFRPSVPERDSALDNAIIAHEYAHFLSGRLVGDSNGLLNQQARSLGEGWSDFFALWMMAREADAVAPNNLAWKGTFAVGSHAKAGTQFSGAGNPAFYLGVRRYPYSANFAKNGLTFKHLQLGQALPAVPGAPTNENTEVHNAGEVWCQMLWEGYSAMLDSPRLSFPVAAERMLGYLVASLKVTPVMPTFLEARDAFLSVVSAKDPQDLQLWTQAFARRGMGYKATGPDRFALDNKPVVEDLTLMGNFVRVTSVVLDDQPGYCDNDKVLDVGELGSLRITLLNVGALALSSTAAIVTSTTPGVTFANGGLLAFGTMGPFASSSASVGVRITGTTALNIPFEITVADPSLTGGNVKTTVTLQANTDAVPAAIEHCEGNVDAWTSDIDSTQTHGFEELFLARTVGQQKEFVGPALGFKADSTLMTPELDVGPSALTMTFKHRWSFETQMTRPYDGARLEVSTDNGATWAPVPPSALTPAYNGAIYALSQASLRGEAAFVDQSPGYPAMTVSQSVAFGTTYAGKKLRVRFRISTDTSGATAGWNVDDIAFTGLNNNPFFDVVKDRAMCVNRPPVVSLGDDRAVNERSSVDLMPVVTDADGQTPTLTWAQTAGPMVTLTGNTFTAPEVQADTALTFQATVSDGTAMAVDAVTLTVKDVNRLPVARAGDPQTVTSGTVVTLGGSGADPDNDPLSFTWTQTGGPTVTLSNDKAAQPTFTAPTVEVSSSLSFALVVRDGKDASPTVATEVVVDPAKRGCGCSGAPDVFGLFALALSLRAWRRRRV